MVSRRAILLGCAAAGIGAPAISRSARAEQAPGVTDTEIRFGNSYPYSGPISGYGTVGRTQAAYFRMINEEQGGVNGRKLNFISYDDAASPPKTVEQTRRLIEEDGVAFIFNTLGTANNTAIVKYLNKKRIPHLFVASGADKWGDYSVNPWTIGWQPSLRVEAQIYAKYLQSSKADGKVGVIYQNDDFGKDYLAGLRDVLGGAFSNVVTASYEMTDTTIDSQITTLKGAGVDILVTAAMPKFAAMTIRKVSDLDWHPLHIMTNVSISVAAVMIPAGPQRGIGMISSAFRKDPTDPGWETDPGIQSWRRFMRKYYPEGDLSDSSNVYGFGVSQTIVHVLLACRNDLSRENILKQALSLDHLSNPIFLPGITQNTSSTNYHPVRQLQMTRWDGTTWNRFGNVIAGSDV